MTVRLGNEVACRLFTANSVTLQSCNAKDVKFVNGLKCWRPAFVTLEFARLRDTRFFIPESPAMHQVRNLKNDAVTLSRGPQLFDIKLT